MTLKIDNKTARRLWLSVQGLAQTPTGPLDLLQIIKDLGFVQLDTIRNVTRAHHHILWSRNQNYREPMLWKLLAEDRALFEHFTHDASLIPMDFYPMWKRQFLRIKKKIDGSWYASSKMNEAEHHAIKARIEQEGPLSTRAFDTKALGKKEMWQRPPHKRALDYMWYCGELSTSYRENFIKFYDLTHRVIPQDKLADGPDDQEQMNWLCGAALERIGFGTIGEIQRFWDALDTSDVKEWAMDNQNLIAVEIENRDHSWTQVLAPANIEQRLAACTASTSRLRVLNPFDPAIRDRNRLKRLFGFDYKIEIFVPAAKRKWGYYVYPMLEGDRFIGRVELKADRKQGLLFVPQIWLEPNVKWTQARAGKLNAELARLAGFIGATDIRWNCAL
ncbi:MAG: YcaQ family DNA glycosylase [Robiginitomaculum sp.]|nr:YcaQ family DNA glycosylase [Robiginitomaculum sp.]